MSDYSDGMLENTYSGVSGLMWLRVFHPAPQRCSRVSERNPDGEFQVVQRQDEEVINYAVTSPFENMDHPLRKDLISTLQDVESDGGIISE